MLTPDDHRIGQLPYPTSAAASSPLQSVTFQLATTSNNHPPHGAAESTAAAHQHTDNPPHNTNITKKITSMASNLNLNTGEWALETATPTEMVVIGINPANDVEIPPKKKDGWRTEKLQAKGGLKLRKFFVGVLVALVLSITNGGIALWLFLDLGQKKKSQYAPVFLAHLVVTAALSYILALLALWVYINIPSKKSDNDSEQGVPLNTISTCHSTTTGRPSTGASTLNPIYSIANGALDTSDNARPGNPTPPDSPHFMHYGNPTRTTTLNNPFFTHPDPLGSSPNMKQLPSLNDLQKSKASAFSEASRGTKSTVASTAALDAINDSEIVNVRMASSVSLTSSRARKVPGIGHD